MEELWTPWRMTYILQAKNSTGCILCLQPSDPTEERLILHRGATVYVLLNLYPYTTGHLMVVPYRHVPRFGALDPNEQREIVRRLEQSERILRQVASARSFHAGANLGRAAGAGVDGHLHLHLVPRGIPRTWGGSEGCTELPVPVEQVYRRLRPYFASLD